MPLGKVLKTEHVDLLNDVCKIIPSFGGGRRQKVDVGRSVEAGNHSCHHWQSVGEGKAGWLG